jgi:NADPH2:quinone reductase
MRAVICRTWGGPESLVVEDVASPTPGPGQVVVSVKACGVNFPNTLIIRGLYQFKPALPFSPGNEVAGVVKAVGRGVDSVKPGERVIAFGLVGGFAEEMLVEAAAVVPMPPAMDFETAACTR